jgi:hypothetical protein
VTAEEFGEVDPGFRSLRNLNTPEEYAQALGELAQSQQSGNLGG